MNYRIYDEHGRMVKTIATNAADLVDLNTPPGGRAEPVGESQSAADLIPSSKKA